MRAHVGIARSLGVALVALICSVSQGHTQAICSQSASTDPTKGCDGAGYDGIQGYPGKWMGSRRADTDVPRTLNEQEKRLFQLASPGGISNKWYAFKDVPVNCRNGYMLLKNNGQPIIPGGTQPVFEIVVAKSDYWYSEGQDDTYNRDTNKAGGLDHITNPKGIGGTYATHRFPSRVSMAVVAYMYGADSVNASPSAQFPDYGANASVPSGVTPGPIIVSINDGVQGTNDNHGFGDNGGCIDVYLAVSQ